MKHIDMFVHICMLVFFYLCIDPEYLFATVIRSLLIITICDEVEVDGLVENPLDV